MGGTGQRKRTYLFVQFHEVGFVLLLQINASVVLVNALTKTFALVGLLASEVSVNGSGERVQRHWQVVAILVLTLLAVGNSFVRDHCGVVGGHVAGQFGEVGGHDELFVISR